MRLAGPHRACRHVITQTWPRERLIRCSPFLTFSTHTRLREQHILDEATFQPLPQPNPKARDIAVLGGGITGLGTAYNLARTIPNAKITIYEQSNRLGGWIDSEILEIDGGEVLFEWGPRNLRPDIGGPGTATVNMMIQLGCLENVIGVSKGHPASTNRYIYYPDHLVRMPAPNPDGNIITTIISALYTVFTEPIFKGVPSSLLAEPSVRVRASTVKDESVGDFLRRRFGPAVADNFASALFHGIYAGDIYQLSARTLFPSLWYLETRDPDGNGVLPELVDLGLKRNVTLPYKNVKFHNMALKAGDKPEFDLSTKAMISAFTECSVYTFTRGLATLPQKIEEVLRQNPNVSIKLSTSVSDVTYHPDKMKFTISSDGQKDSKKYDYIVSSLRPNLLANFLSSSAKLRLATIDPNIIKSCTWSDKSVSVMVVNLYYASPDTVPSKYQGFGYLLPRSVPLEQNPERALGVIFSSQTSGGNGAEAFIQKPFPSIKQIKEVTEMKTMVENRIAENKAKLAERREKLAHPAAADIRERIEKQMKHLHDVQTEIQRQLTMVQEHEKNNPAGTPFIARVGQDTAPGTKLTVMLGGHWWDGWSESDLPSEDEAIEMAKSILQRHLKITEQPLLAKARLQRDAIPQYQPHYREAMATIHKGLMSEFHGRFKVAGPWWQGGVGVNDCLRKARETAFAIREGWDENTGLEEYTKDEEWCLLDGRTGTVMMDPMNQ